MALIKNENIKLTHINVRSGRDDDDPGKRFVNVDLQFNGNFGVEIFDAFLETDEATLLKSLAYSDGDGIRQFARMVKGKVKTDIEVLDDVDVFVKDNTLFDEEMAFERCTLRNPQFGFKDGGIVNCTFSVAVGHIDPKSLANISACHKTEVAITICKAKRLPEDKTEDEAFEQGVRDQLGIED